MLDLDILENLFRKEIERNPPIMSYAISIMKELKAAREVVEAARDMSQRLQSLPWSKNKDGTMVMIDTATWKQWNYGECQVLHNTVAEYDKVAGRYSKEQGE